MGPTFTLLTAGLMAAQTAVQPPMSISPTTANPSAAAPCNCQKGAAPAGHIDPVAETESPGLFRGLFRARTEPAAPVMSEDRPILSRIQGFFGGGKSESPEIVNTSEPAMARPAMPAGPGARLLKMPVGQAVPPVVQPVRAEPLSIPTAVPPAPIRVQPVTYKAVPVGQAEPAPMQSVQPVATIGAPIAPASTVLPPSRPNRISPELVNKVGHESDYSWITGQLRVENGVYVLHYATPETVDTYNGSLALTSDRDLRSFHDGDFVSVRGSVSGSGARAMYRVTGIDRLPR